MSLLVGTTSGVYDLEGRPVIETARISHLSQGSGDWWAVDAKGAIHRGGELVDHLPDGAVPKCVRTDGSDAWIGASEGRLYRLEAGEGPREDEAFARAPGRDAWYTPWGAPADVRSLTVDAGGTLHVGVHVGGIYRREEGGEYVPTLDLKYDVHEVAAHPSRAEALFAATAYGLAVATDGSAYELETAGLHAPYCRAVAVSEAAVLVSASTGPRTERARIYRSPVAGGPLEPATSGLPEWFDENIDSHCLAFHEGVAYAGLDHTIWASEDDGETWEEARGGLARITCLG